MDKTNAILDKALLPKHVAIIMDGNGRWAKKRGLLRLAGHRSATKAVKETVEYAARWGVKYLTLYAFSTENWNRPKTEVDALMNLLMETLNKEINPLQENEIKLQAIGNLSKLPDFAFKTLHEVIEKTHQNNRMTLTLALSYSAREEIVQAVKDLTAKVKNNIISPDDIDQSMINNHLYTQNLPDVDLMIRTSGELRISNFMLWQAAYAEFYFTPVLWPDFRKEHLLEALLDYQKRERRFGKTSEQLA